MVLQLADSVFIKKILSTKAGRSFSVVVGLLVFGVIGTVLLSHGSASTNVVHFEAESGAIAGSALVLTGTDASGASGGAAVKFGSASGPLRALKVMPLGDSITYGYATGSYRLSLYQMLVTQDGYNMDFVGSQNDGPTTMPDRDHEGHSGWTIDGIKGSVAGWLNASNPDVVLIHIGTNDILKDKSSGPVALAKLDSLLQTIYDTKPNIMVITASLIPMYSYNDPCVLCQASLDYDAGVPAIVAKYKNLGKQSYYANMDTAGIQENGDLQPNDGIHPTPAGYTKMANVWYPVLKPLFRGSAPNPNPNPPATGTVNDTTFTYSGSWQTSTGTAKYQNDDHYSSTTGSQSTIAFTGTQIKLYASEDVHHGQAMVSVDGAAATTIDFYASARQDQALVYTSPTLASGTHSLVLTVAGTHNAASTGNTITTDRADITQ